MFRRHQTCYFRKHVTFAAAELGGEIRNASRNRAPMQVILQAQKLHVYGSGAFGAFWKTNRLLSDTVYRLLCRILVDNVERRHDSAQHRMLLEVRHVRHDSPQKLDEQITQKLDEQITQRAHSTWLQRGARVYAVRPFCTKTQND